MKSARTHLGVSSLPAASSTQPVEILNRRPDASPAHSSRPGKKTPPRRLFSDRERPSIHFAGRVLWTCLLIEGVLLLMDSTLAPSRGAAFGSLSSIIDVTHRDSLASWFHTGQTLLAAATMWLVFRMEKLRAPGASIKWTWLVAAGIFGGISLNARLGITERVNAHLAVDWDLASLFASPAALASMAGVGAVALALGVLIVLDLTSWSERLLLVTGALISISAFGAQLALADLLPVLSADVLAVTVGMLGMSLMWFVFVKRLEDSLNAIWSTKRAASVGSLKTLSSAA